MRWICSKPCLELAFASFGIWPLHRGKPGRGLFAKSRALLLFIGHVSRPEPVRYEKVRGLDDIGP